MEVPRSGTVFCTGNVPYVVGVSAIAADCMRWDLGKLESLSLVTTAPPAIVRFTISLASYQLRVSEAREDFHELVHPLQLRPISALQASDSSTVVRLQGQDTASGIVKVLEGLRRSVRRSTNGVDPYGPKLS